MNPGELTTTFARLHEILEPHLPETTVVTDEPGSLYLEEGPPENREMFAAVAVKTASVAFHYMPLYADPALLDTLPPDLARRRKGKSCFHFRRSDDPAIDELRALLAATAGPYLSRAR